MALLPIRMFGDPVLKQRAAEVTEIDDAIVRLAHDMVETMHEAPGVGLAAPQVGVLKRVFVYDVSEGQDPHVLINPKISDHRGEWEYEEGCLSIPGIYFPVIRPKEVHVTGVDLDGNDVSFEADELRARVVQHELDHLDGILFLDRLERDQRKEAMRQWRSRAVEQSAEQPAERAVG